MKDDNIAFVISTCKKYEKVFLKFWEIFFKYEIQERYNVYILSDKKLEFYSNCKNVRLCNIDKEWSDRTRIFLKNIKEDYIIHILDDFIIENIDYNKLDKLLEYIVTHKEVANIIFENLSSIEDKKITNNLYLRNWNDRYKTSLQIGIWKKEVFLQLLKGNYSPWEFEVFANFETYLMKEQFLCVEVSPIDYNKGFYIVQGHVNRKEADRLSKKFNINFFDVDLPIRDKIVRDDINFINRVCRRIKIEKYRVIYFIKLLMTRGKNYD